MILDDEDRKALQQLVLRARPSFIRIFSLAFSIILLAIVAGLAVRLFEIAAGA